MATNFLALRRSARKSNRLRCSNERRHRQPDRGAGCSRGRFAARAETDVFNIIAAVADLPADLWRVLPDGLDALLPLAGPTIMVAAAIILTLALARLLVRRQRRKIDAEGGALGGLL